MYFHIKTCFSVWLLWRVGWKEFALLSRPGRKRSQVRGKCIKVQSHYNKTCWNTVDNKWQEEWIMVTKVQLEEERVVRGNYNGFFTVMSVHQITFFPKMQFFCRLEYNFKKLIINLEFLCFLVQFQY